MAYSGDNILTLTEAEIIQEAVEHCGIDGSETIETHIYASARRSLNLLLKSWQSKGLFLHTYKEATLFLEKNATSYLLGPSGDHATESFVETTLAADAANGATTITLTSTTGISNADYIGVVLDDGTLHWSTVSNAAGTTIADGLASAATSGNAVYAYTTKISRPLKVTDVRLKDADGSELPIRTISLEEYSLLPNKTSTGRPIQVAYDPQLTAARLYTWLAADDVTSQLVFRYKKPVDNMEDTAHDAMIPADWFMALTLGLAYHLSPKLQVPLAEQAGLKARYDEAMSDIDDFEETSIFFQPERSR